MDDQGQNTSSGTSDAALGRPSAALELPEATKSALGRQRIALKSAMTDMEGCLARPVANGDDWLARVAAAQETLATALQQHIEVHEGADSFHAQVVAEQPGLAARVRKLQHEHVRDTADSENLRTLVAEAQTESAGKERAELLDQIRQAAGDLLVLLAHHRQHGADLVWESANLDLGGGD